jgi:hypothetical protein
LALTGLVAAGAGVGRFNIVPVEHTGAALGV